jgi:tripartite-type tricarboxylate transporter receptor subunit TctC
MIESQAHPRRIGAVVLIAIAGLVASPAAPACAQAYPSKPIRIMAPVAAGAATDLLARIAAEWIGKQTGQTVIVENRSGAGGNLALETVARAEPDGHTLLVATNGAITINRALVKRSPIDTLTDVVPVAPLAWFPNILVINSKLPARSAQEFIALARSKPGTINYASAGPGTTPHLAVALFARLAGIDLVHVPYRGMAPAMNDLVTGNVQAVAIGNATVAPFVEQGTLRVLAVAGPQRLSYLPDVPTAAEAGVPGWEVETWWGVFAPRGTPQPIVDQLNGYITGLWNDAAARKRFDDGFYDSMNLSAAAFAARVKADVEKWQRIVKDAGVEPQ